MRIAIIDPDMKEIYKDAFYEKPLDFFDSYQHFLNYGNGFYKVIIMAHRINGEHWENAYNQFIEDPFVIVTATFIPDHYKLHEPMEAYTFIENINKYKNCIFHLKNDYEGILQSITIEEIYHSLNI